MGGIDGDSIVGDGLRTGRRRDAESEFGDSWTGGVIAVARHGRAKEWDRGGGRHGEIVLPFPRQEQLVRISEGSHNGEANENECGGDGGRKGRKREGWWLAVGSLGGGRKRGAGDKSQVQIWFHSRGEMGPL